MSDLPDDALRVVALLPTDPAHRDAVRAGVAELVAATRAEEGCYAYDAFESGATPGLFVTVEAWRNQEDLDAHMQTAHVAKAFETLGSALTGEVAIHPLTAVG